MSFGRGITVHKPAIWELKVLNVSFGNVVGGSSHQAQWPVPEEINCYLDVLSFPLILILCSAKYIL